MFLLSVTLRWRVGRRLLSERPLSKAHSPRWDCFVETVCPMIRNPRAGTGLHPRNSNQTLIEVRGLWGVILPRLCKLNHLQGPGRGSSGPGGPAVNWGALAPSKGATSRWWWPLNFKACVRQIRHVWGPGTVPGQLLKSNLSLGKMGKLRPKEAEQLPQGPPKLIWKPHFFQPAFTAVLFWGQRVLPKVCDGSS